MKIKTWCSAWTLRLGLEGHWIGSVGMLVVSQLQSGCKVPERDERSRSCLNNTQTGVCIARSASHDDSAVNTFCLTLIGVRTFTLHSDVTNIFFRKCLNLRN